MKTASMKDKKMIIRLFMLISLVLFVTNCTPIAPNAKGLHVHDPAEVVNKSWLWEKTVNPVESLSVADPERYTIRFAENGKLEAKFDCNRGGGTYAISEGRVSFGPLMSTRMACPEDSQDAVFMRDLQRVTSFFLQDGMLFLELPFDSGAMRFRALP